MSAGSYTPNYRNYHRYRGNEPYYAMPYERNYLGNWARMAFPESLVNTAAVLINPIGRVFLTGYAGREMINNYNKQKAEEERAARKRAMIESKLQREMDRQDTGYVPFSSEERLRRREPESLLESLPRAQDRLEDVPDDTGIEVVPDEVVPETRPMMGIVPVATEQQQMANLQALKDSLDVNFPYPYRFFRSGPQTSSTLITSQIQAIGEAIKNLGYNTAMARPEVRALRPAYALFTKVGLANALRDPTIVIPKIMADYVPDNIAAVIRAPIRQLSSADTIYPRTPDELRKEAAERYRGLKKYHGRSRKNKK